MPPVGFEPTISAGERPQTYALDRAATGTGAYHLVRYENQEWFVIDWLIDWSIDRLPDWLIDWLIDTWIYYK